MQRISDLRGGLGNIDGALLDLPPADEARANEPGVVVHTLSPGTGQDQATAPDVGEASGHQESEDDSPLLAFDPIFEIGSQNDQTLPSLGDLATERFRQSVLIRGMDALGWYSSFHVTGVQWGAYVSLSGIAYLAQASFANLPATPETKLRLAFHAILHHELFHFATDYAIAQAELSQQQAWWRPAKLSRIHREPPYLAVEEMLANAWMLKSFRTAIPALKVSGKQDALRRFVRSQPHGYCYGDVVRTKAEWRAHLHTIAYRYAEDSGHEQDNRNLWGRSGHDWPALFPIHPRVDWRFCPIHLVDDSQTYGLPPGWLDFFSRLANVEESDKFKKHLSRLSSQIQQAWQRTKTKLQVAITAGDDFKRWTKAGPDIYSVRVNSAFRAHLLHDRSTRRWIALDIGGHKEMGHG